ncbi:Proteasome component (PCI) domain [Macleaya cordata]|uniref:Proteasome component (PCI) domain n=1 Tax=Macleaya cordata TaxID=56857 RepID=A0A200R011_MACCD|nr:Proteasome component (PCI) domain [Macleaya cordata]
MANLIGFSFDPKHESREVRMHHLSQPWLIWYCMQVSKGVMSCASQEVKDLYHLLEHEFLPLDLASRVHPLLNKISKLGGKLSSASSVPEVQLLQYVPALEKLATLRLLQQVSQVYQTMKIEVLSSMIPFFDFLIVEKVSVDAVKSNFIAMKVDHQKGAVFFGSLDLESERLLDHLTVLAESLNKARALIYAPVKKTSEHGETLPGLAEVVSKEHKRLLARKSIIEKRKEEQEWQMLEMEREEESKRLKLQKITEEEQRIQREIEERELEEAQALLQEAEKRSKKKGKKPVIEGEKVTKQSLIELASSEQLRERQEMEKKLQKLAKTMDYMERAKREEEAPLIDAAFQQQLVEGRVIHEHEQQQEIELSMQRHAGDLQEKNRMARMLESKIIFQNNIVSRRESEFNRLKEEREERINQLLQIQRQEREAKRKMIFYLRSVEERQKKLQEEEAARKQEEAERQRMEEAKRKAKLDEIAERQRMRLLEVEEKKMKDREPQLGRSFEPPPPKQTASVEPAAAPVGAAAPTPGKYKPPSRKLREGSVVAPQEPDRWGSRQDDHRLPQSAGDRWRSDDHCLPQSAGDRWRSDDRKSSFSGSSRSSTWSSSRRGGSER